MIAEAFASSESGKKVVAWLPEGGGNLDRAISALS